MNIWTQLLNVPGMGGVFVLTSITLWLVFLGSLVVWVARAPHEDAL